MGRQRTVQVVYSADYREGSFGQQLTVIYRSSELPGKIRGIATPHSSATLQSAAPRLQSVNITNAAGRSDHCAVNFNPQRGQDRAVEYADYLPATGWSNLITQPGNGAVVTMTNQDVPDPQRYFPVRTP